MAILIGHLDRIAACVVGLDTGKGEGRVGGLGQHHTVHIPLVAQRSRPCRRHAQRCALANVFDLAAGLRHDPRVSHRQRCDLAGGTAVAVADNHRVASSMTPLQIIDGQCGIGGPVQRPTVFAPLVSQRQRSCGRHTETDTLTRVALLANRLGGDHRVENSQRGHGACHAAHAVAHHHAVAASVGSQNIAYRQGGRGCPGDAHAIRQQHALLAPSVTQRLGAGGAHAETGARACIVCAAGWLESEIRHLGRAFQQTTQP